MSVRAADSANVTPYAWLNLRSLATATCTGSGLACGRSSTVGRQSAADGVVRLVARDFFL
jgi:hypothetical protein